MSRPGRFMRAVESVGSKIPYLYGAAMGGAYIGGVFDEKDDPVDYVRDRPQSSYNINKLKRKIWDYEESSSSRNVKPRRRGISEYSSLGPQNSSLSMPSIRGFRRRSRRRSRKGSYRAGGIRRRSMYRRRSFSRKGGITRQLRRALISAQCEAPHVYDKLAYLRDTSSYGRQCLFVPGFKTGADVGTTGAADHAFTDNPALYNDNPGPFSNMNQFGTDSFWNSNMFVKLKESLRYTMVNRDTNKVHVNVFYCRARDDIYYDSQPSVTITPYRMLVKSSQNDVSNTYVTPRWTPYRSSDFCSLFKIYKKRSYKLVPGQEVSWSVAHMKPALRACKDYDINANPAPASTRRVSKYMNKGSKFCVILAYGEVVNGSGGEIGLVSTSHVALDLMLNWHIKLKYSYDNSIHYKAQNGLAAAFVQPVYGLGQEMKIVDEQD